MDLNSEICKLRKQCKQYELGKECGEQVIKNLLHALDVAEMTIQLLSRSSISNVLEAERQLLIDYYKEQAKKELELKRVENENDKI